jgi:hypothetical protein
VGGGPDGARAHADQLSRTRVPVIPVEKGPSEAGGNIRVERAALQSCEAPRLLRNVVLAGEPGGKPNLHQPWPAPLDTVAGLFHVWARPHARRRAGRVTQG